MQLVSLKHDGSKALKTLQLILILLPLITAFHCDASANCQLVEASVELPDEDAFGNGKSRERGTGDGDGASRDEDLLFIVSSLSREQSTYYDFFLGGLTRLFWDGVQLQEGEEREQGGEQGGEQEKEAKQELEEAAGNEDADEERKKRPGNADGDRSSKKSGRRRKAPSSSGGIVVQVSPKCARAVKAVKRGLNETRKRAFACKFCLFLSGL